MSAVAEYEKQKQNSILEFCREDEECSVPREVWEGGKRDYANELYEKAEKANDQKKILIIERDVLQIIWRVECLRRQMDMYIKLSSPTLLKRPTVAIPSIVSNIKLIGTFPTMDWRDDPAWVDMGFDPADLFGGIYRVVDFDIHCCNGSVMKLNAVVNDGDPDANTGFWGGIFTRDSSKQVATICSDGDSCTKIVEVSSNLASSFVPFAETDLDFTFHETGDRRFREPGDEDCPLFSDSLTPGFCTTQFEKIMGMVMDRFMNNTWKPFEEYQPRARPKRPLSAYNRFFKDERNRILEGFDGRKIGGFENLAKTIGERWAKLPAKELAVYKELANDDMERYKREMAKEVQPCEWEEVQACEWEDPTKVMQQVCKKREKGR